MTYWILVWILNTTKIKRLRTNKILLVNISEKISITSILLQTKTNNVISYNDQTYIILPIKYTHKLIIYKPYYFSIFCIERGNVNI